MTEMLQAAMALIQSVQQDNSIHGGLLSRDTIRAADELRLIVLRANHENPLIPTGGHP